MNINDFRYMRQGKQLRGLEPAEAPLLQPIRQYNQKTERALLVLHGFSSSPAVYRSILPKIKKYDAIICPTLPGHGDSIDAFSQFTAANWLDASRTLCDELVNKYRKVDVLGLSLGGLLACELSKQFNLNHLFLLAPALSLRMHIAPVLKMTRVFKSLGFIHLRNAAGNLLNEQLAEITYRKLPLATIIEMLQLVLNYQWIAPTCPVDLFLGAHDEVVCSKSVAQLFQPLANARIHWLKNSAHVLALDNDLNEIIECINTVSSLDRQPIKLSTEVD